MRSMSPPDIRAIPETVRTKGRKGRRNRLKGVRGRGTLEIEKPLIFGMIARGGQAVIRVLENMQQQTIEPSVKATIATDSLIYTNEYGVYNTLTEAISIKRYVVERVDTCGIMMVMAFVRFMSVRWRAFGCSCAPD